MHVIWFVILTLHFLFLFWVVSQVFTFSQKMSVNFQLLLRFIQGLAFLVALAGVVIAVVLTELSLPDIFACILAFVPTGWGILSVSSLHP
jgi:callose synthase